MSNEGGFGSKGTNSVWLEYRAKRGGAPFGKLCQWISDGKGGGEEIAHDWASGTMDSVYIRTQEGRGDIDDKQQIVVTLLTKVDGEDRFIKLPFNASSSAGFSIARRLPNIAKGDKVELSSWVAPDKSGEKRAHCTIKKLIGGSQVTIEAVDTGIEFRTMDGLSETKKKVAVMENAAMREEWVLESVADLPYFVDKNATQPTAPTADEYDPYADE